MKAPHGLQVGVWFLAGSSVLLVARPSTCAADEVEGLSAVSSKVSSDYVRTKLHDGSFQPEFYAFGEGGIWGGEIKDATIDKLHFVDVAKIIANPLATQKYLPAKNPDKTKLLIMVYWGTTAVPAPTENSDAVERFGYAQGKLNMYITRAPSGKETVGGGPMADAAMSQWSAALTMLTLQNEQNNRTDFANAQMLGYDSPGLIGTEKGNYLKGTAFGAERDDLYAEIEENRYFVVLMAYDFQLLWKEKKHKLLWETRFSINERHNQFDKVLPVMAQFASRYFGEDSNGLLRTRVPEGRV